MIGVSRKAFYIIMSILVTAVIALGYLNIEMDRKAAPAEIEIGMTNKNIEWTGAGYNGFWEKQK